MPKGTGRICRLLFGGPHVVSVAHRVVGTLDPVPERVPVRLRKRTYCRAETDACRRGRRSSPCRPVTRTVSLGSISRSSAPSFGSVIGEQLSPSWTEAVGTISSSRMSDPKSSGPGRASGETVSGRLTPTTLLGRPRRSGGLTRQDPPQRFSRGTGPLGFEPEPAVLAHSVRGFAAHVSRRTFHSRLALAARVW